jgi:Ala-tRNA(Pro) deacylase
MNIAEYLQKQKIPFERLSHATAYTAQELAALEHVPGRYVAKPVLVKAAGQFVLCVLPAPAMVDLERVADALGADSAKLAKEDELSAVFKDCELGAEPPFGQLYGLKTLMDQALHQDEYIVFQAGSHTDAVKMRRDDYERLVHPQVASFARQVT